MSAFVQHLGAVSFASTDTTTVLSISKTVSAGNRIIVGGFYNVAIGTPSCADNLGNTYTLDDALGGEYASNHPLVTFSAPVTTGGTLTTITMTQPSSVYRALTAGEFSGVGAFSASGHNAGFA